MYQTELEQYLSEHPHNEEGSTEENWMALKDCIMSCAEKCVGRSKRKQPDWFKDAIDVLTPLLADKQEAYNRFLCTQNSETKKEFRKCQRNVKKAVDEVKEKWIRNVIRDAELNNKDGKQKWQCIRKLQLAYAGRKPIRSAKFYKQDGSMTETPEEVQKVWVEHFTKVLNVTSQYQQELVDEVPSLDEITTLDVPPSQEELINAMTKLKQGKAGGKTGILPELLINGGPLLFNRLLQLMKDVWHTGDVVKDWKDAEIVPIPKKGDLRHCDNWRGISLLDVVGKLFGRILQDRLQVVAEKVLPESQCGFRKGRGCVDMIFVARQLIEKCREHEDSLFALFVDLRKAYDSVPRHALWQVVKKCGVPPNMLSLVQSFHEGLVAAVRCGSGTTDDICVTNGLRQGCTMAPILFNLYFAAMVARWRIRCPRAGVVIRYGMGRKLVGDRTAKKRLKDVRITESKFADDVALYAASRGEMEKVAEEFVQTGAGFGLTVSLEKTKLMALGPWINRSDNLPICLNTGMIDPVDNFTYLGSNITKDGEVTSEVTLRLEAARAFGCLRSSIFQNQHLNIPLNRDVYCAVVLPTLLYGAETRAVKAPSVRKLQSFHNRCFRKIVGVSRHQQWKERMTSEELAEEFGMIESMADTLRKHPSQVARPSR